MVSDWSSDVCSSDLNRTELKIPKGIDSWNDFGRLVIDSPLERTIGKRKLNRNWKKVIQNGSADKSLKAFCVPSTTISITDRKSVV